MMKFIKLMYSRQISQQFGMPLYMTVFSSHRVYTKKQVCIVLSTERLFF